MCCPLLRLVYVGEGVTLALFPHEDPDQIAAKLAAHFDETERRPGLDWLPTDEEIEQWLLEDDDGHETANLG